MAFLLVGGTARGVGKTAVVCQLLRELRSLSPIAVKVTTHMHGGSLWQEELPSRQPATTDTARYLAAGARRALLVTLTPETLARIEEEFAREQLVILESTRLIGQLRTRYSILLAGAKEEAKPREEVMDSSLFDSVVFVGKKQEDFKQNLTSVEGNHSELPATVLEAVRKAFI